MNEYHQLSQDYQRIEQAILFLEENYRRQPTLAEVAQASHLSEYHFQRLFTRWAGISPKRFLQFLTKESAKRLLEGSGSLLETALGSGLSGLGRLHDLFVTCEAVTPGQYKYRGQGMQIRYGIHDSPFGPCLLGETDLGICHLAFIRSGEQEQALAAFQQRWQRAALRRDQAGTQVSVRQVFEPFQQAEPGAGPLSVFLSGTNFQIKVWEALLRIPSGRAVSYHDLAAHLGSPNAARAVGQAVAANPVAYLIPCHRVLRGMGEFGGYQGGPARKKALLGWELSRVLATAE